MPVSPADFEFYSRMTGQPIPNTPAGRMAIAPQVYNMRRGGGGFGDASHSVTASKQRKLKSYAALFVSRQKAWSHHPCRFDVITYDAAKGDGEPVWIRAAFD